MSNQFECFDVEQELNERSIRKDGEGRTVDCCIVEYNKLSSPMAGRFEKFAPGSLTKTTQERGEKITLNLGHPVMHRGDATARGQLIGKAVEFYDSPRGMYGAFKIANTTAGNDTIEMIKDGLVHAGSLGFSPLPGRTREFVTDRRERGEEILEARMGHFALLTTEHSPAYAGAGVLELRAQDEEEQERERAATFERERIRILRLRTA